MHVTLDAGRPELARSTPGKKGARVPYSLFTTYAPCEL